MAAAQKHAKRSTQVKAEIEAKFRMDFGREMTAQEKRLLLWAEQILPSQSKQTRSHAKKKSA